jgi:anti-anti-sigma regulatory factor
MISAVAQARTHVALSGPDSWVRSRERHRTVVTVEGELDSASSGAVGADASDAIVDMAGIDVIDRSGLDAVIRTHRLFEILGLSLTRRAPSRPVRHLLDGYQPTELISAEAR